jgi:uncharacterized protein (DUF1800 family)
VFETQDATSRFLARSTFGPTREDISSLTGTRASDWFKSELEKSQTQYLQPMLDYEASLPPNTEIPRRLISDLFFDAAIAGEDQLRQRMIFALSELIVVSASGQLANYPPAMGYYMDTLSDHAFGNYRDLLEEVTYSPAMAFYLTYLANPKGDPVSGRVPDENYARELLQLFTIGLNELNMDGTPKLGSDGNPMETFDNNDITGLARVFTGMSTAGSDFFRVLQNDDALYTRMEVFDGFHSDLEKSFLGQTISANTGGFESIDRALDIIFEHPNVAPFVSRQLIQRFVTSNPEPAYVERVAITFEAGTFVLPDGTSIGTGERGDLSATLAAILFDENAIRTPEDVPVTFGKVREPVIRFTNWARAFNETTPDSADETILGSTFGFGQMGQFPFYSPSVFNFFRPGYVAPNSETGEAGLTAPELQIVNESTSIAYINIMNAFIYDFAENVSGDNDGGVKPDYSYEFSIADNTDALINHLDLLLTGNRLSEEERQRLSDIMAEVPIRAGTENEDRFTRITLGITMTMTSPGYLVQK